MRFGDGRPSAPSVPSGEPHKLPVFKDAWDENFIVGLACDLAYGDLKSRLDAFASARDICMVDFLEEPNMHVPLLYMDVRNRVRFREGGVPSSAALHEGLARALLLLVRVYQDTCACEQVMGSSHVSHIPALFHKKLIAWITPHFQNRELQLAKTATRAAATTGGVRPQFPPSSGTERRGDSARAPKRQLNFVEQDYLFTGWPTTLSFLSVVTRLRELVAHATPLPLPVWVPCVYRSSLPGSFTIYFQNALSTMKAAASNNQKIKAVRVMAANTMLEALTSLKTWKGFLKLKFTTKTVAHHPGAQHPPVSRALSSEDTDVERRRSASPSVLSGVHASQAGFIRVVASP